MTMPADFFAAVAALGAIETLDVDALRLLYESSARARTSTTCSPTASATSAPPICCAATAARSAATPSACARCSASSSGTPYEPSREDALALSRSRCRDAISAEFLPLIVQGELDGDTGYQRWADRESDPEAQRLLRLNGREETTHGERVREVIVLLKRAQR